MVKKWIQDAIKPNSKGALRKTLGVKKGRKMPEEMLEKASKSKNPTTRKRADLAITLKKMRKK